MPSTHGFRNVLCGLRLYNVLGSALCIIAPPVRGILVGLAAGLGEHTTGKNRLNVGHGGGGWGVVVARLQ
jgi:hypothetical protein